MMTYSKLLLQRRKIQTLQLKKILSYKSALFLGLEEIKKRPFISTNLCVKLVQEIKLNKSSIRVTPGTALLNGRGQVVYTPPSGEETIRKKFIQSRKVHE